MWEFVRSIRQLETIEQQEKQSEKCKDMVHCQKHTDNLKPLNVLILNKQLVIKR